MRTPVKLTCVGGPEHGRLVELEIDRHDRWYTPEQVRPSSNTYPPGEEGQRPLFIGHEYRIARFATWIPSALLTYLGPRKPMQPNIGTCLLSQSLTEEEAWEKYFKVGHG